MKTAITHPTATEIEFHDGSLSLEYTLRDANGNAVSQRVRASVGIADDYVARKLAETMGFDAGPAESRWRVSKDTIIGRVSAAGKLPQVMAALAAQPQEDQFVWANSAWFWSNNATLRGLCAHPAIGLDADAVLAPDPFL
jgi:hypothetical protein